MMGHLHLVDQIDTKAVNVNKLKYFGIRQIESDRAAMIRKVQVTQCATN